MAQINMPPTGVGPDFPRKPIEVCQTYSGDLTIDIGSPGFMAHFPDGSFTPDIPNGFVIAGQHLGPFKPVKNNVSVFLSYFDFNTQKLYITKINIKTTCPGAPAKKKASKKGKSK